MEDRGSVFKGTNIPENIRKDLPIFIVSGTEDPVGNYGKGPDEVYASLIAQGVTDISRKLYPDMRHEILNEIDKETVWNEICHWMQSKQALSI